MNWLCTARKAQIVRSLVEGNSIRATCRMVGVVKDTVLKPLVELGPACEDYHDESVRNLVSRRIQADEIWSFRYSKAKNVPARLKGMPGVGDVWMWTALDPDSKLMVSWLVGGRDAGWAHEFMLDVSSRGRNHVQLTTDGHNVCLNAVENAFGLDVSYAQLEKIYCTAPETQTRYSPAICLGTKRRPIIGAPDPGHICTSHVERANLTMRMGMRHFTRLTNAFSKKLENHRAAVSLHFMHYKLARTHQTLRVTPAVHAWGADHVWEIEEIVGLLG